MNIPGFRNEVPVAALSGSSNIMLRIKRSMRAMGIAMSDARWTYVRIFVAVCALRGQLERSKVAHAMAEIIRDHNHVVPPQACTVRLGYQITKLRQMLMTIDGGAIQFILRQNDAAINDA